MSSRGAILATPAVQNAPAVLLRLDCSLAARVAAGVGVPAQQDEGLRKTVRDLWKRAREQWQGAFWATWTRNDRGHAWNERARALALIGSTGRVMGGSRWGAVTHMLPNYVERILIIRKGRAGFSTVLQKLGIGALAR